MWSRTQNYPLNNDDDDQLHIINRFFDFMNNTRRLNNRIIEQNDNLAEMGYEMIIEFTRSLRNTNTNSNTRPSNTSSNTNPSRPSNTSRRRRSRNNRSNLGNRSNISNRYNDLRNDWRNLNRNNRDFTRNVRARNINTNNVNRNNVNRSNIQSPLTNIIPMFGPLSFQPTNNNNLEQLFQQALQPVTIIPTPEQIERATEERIFEEILQPINDTCPITRNRFNNNENVLQILECRHCFNPVSLRTWFESSVRCPICRYDIREYNPLNVVNNPYRNTNNAETNIINNNIDNDTNNGNTVDNDDNDNNNDNDTVDDDNDNDTVDTTSSQDLARELVMNELDNINNNPLITEQQRNLANIISQSITAPTTNEELIQAETSIDSNGNLNLTYQFGVNFPTPP